MLSCLINFIFNTFVISYWMYFVVKERRKKFFPKKKEKNIKSNKGRFINSKPKTANKPRIPLVLKFNRTLPNIKEIIDKHWHLLQIKPKLKNIFQERPIIGYRKNRNLKEIIGSNKILNYKVIRKKKAKKKHLCYT